ncbi:MAG TPA: chorismate mutase [Solirubrobacterales bacterium]|jgi:chorismate mutase|nr:chorismate mutase [Solirubrobacterales bacterium]
MSEDLRLWAVRGATKVGRNDPGLIVEATEELMRELISRNDLAPERMVSCIFTSTHDLNAEFPAVAARKLGLDMVPLLCAQEIDVPNAMRSVIRVLLHYYAPPDHAPAHAYLGEAQDLRSDLKAAQ